MTLPNSVGLFTVKIFLAEKQTSKVKIPLFWGFLLPSDFPKSGGTLSRHWQTVDRAHQGGGVTQVKKMKRTRRY